LLFINNPNNSVICMFVAVDGGGTGSRIVVTDESGNILKYFDGPPLNINTLGDIKFERNIRNILEKLRNTISFDDSVFCFDLAGVTMNERRISNIIRRVGIKYFKLISDIEATFLALGGGKDCIVVSAGTGSFVYGCRKNICHRVGGWGYIIDDEGSGYWVGRRALKYAFMSFDGRIGKTILIRKINDFFNVSTLKEIIPIIYKGYISPRKISELSKIVNEAAKEGDEIAQKIFDEASLELFVMIDVVASKIGLSPTDTFKIYATGGLMLNVELFRKKLEEYIIEKYPRFQFSVKRVSNTVGALMICYKYKYEKFDQKFYNKIIYKIGDLFL